MSQDLYQDFLDVQRDWQTSMKMLKPSGIAVASAERDYHIELASKIAELRADEVPVTIADKIAKGDRKVATARYKWGEAEAVYYANKAAEMGYKKAMSIIDSQMNRDWSAAKREPY